MSSYEHSCGDCKHVWFDNEEVRCCINCSSPNISNCPDDDFNYGKEEVEEEIEREVPLFI